MLTLKAVADSGTSLAFDFLRQDSVLCAEVQRALYSECLLPSPNLPYDERTYNALVRFKRNHKLTGGNWIGPTTATRLLQALKAGRPLLVSLEQANTVYGSRIVPRELHDLNGCLVRFGITATPDIRHFLAQTAHESGGLRWLKELASGEDYEYRYDLGNTEPGDGPRFKGAGAIQLTGRANYQAFANYIGDPKIMRGCDYVAEQYPFSSAGFWWKAHNMSELIAKGGDIYQVTQRVNGGQNGIEARKKYYALACQVIEG